MSEDEAATYFNDQWSRFDETDDSTPMGVAIHMVLIPDSLFLNTYCSTWSNPVKNSTCYQGEADCRGSVNILNHKVMVNNDTGVIKPEPGRQTGYIYNIESVEEDAKCSCIWVGETIQRLNNGCGLGAPGPTSCDNAQCAFKNQCNGHTCTEDDPQVKKALCKGYGGDVQMPSAPDVHNLCFLEGKSIDYHGQPDYKPGPNNNLRAMLKERMKFNSGTSQVGNTPNCETGNEVVVDERLFLDHMTSDPAKVIQAFVYIKGAAEAKSHATKMRDEFVREMKVDVQKEQIPILAIDSSAASVGTGPFQAGSKETLFF